MKVRSRRPNGTGSLHTGGYLEHRSNGRRQYEHILVAERALGKPLPDGAIVHHVNEDRLDNRPPNLVICPSDAYHRLLHQRMRALAACGNANWQKCKYCGKYDDPALMVRRKRNHGRSDNFVHRECRNAYEKVGQARRKLRSRMASDSPKKSSTPQC